MVVSLTEREEEGHVRGKYGLMFRYGEEIIIKLHTTLSRSCEGKIWSHVLLWRGNNYQITHNIIKVINLFLVVIHGGLTELA